MFEDDKRYFSVGHKSIPEPIIGKITPMLTGIVGTARSRISQFMNKFRKLSSIDYNGQNRAFSTSAIFTYIYIRRAAQTGAAQ